MEYQSLPLDLVASLPSLPFPIYLRRDDRMILYAMSGADPRAILGHARCRSRGPRPEHRRRCPASTCSWSSSPGRSRRDPNRSQDRGRRAVAFALALLDPLFGPERGIDPEAFAAGQAVVDLLSAALAVEPDLGRQIVGAHASPGVVRRGRAPTQPAQARRFVTRALDGLACAMALATTLDPLESGVLGTTLLELGKGVVFRDLGLSRRGSGASAGRPTRPGAGGSPTVRATRRSVSG